MTDESTRNVLYQATSQHWAHAEQIRWTLLYNYLTASMILLLAWTTVLASSSSNQNTGYILLILATAGVFLSILWLALGVRASGFVNMYSTTGRALEPPLVPSLDPDSTRLGPFASAWQYRRTMTGIGRLVPSHFVLWFVPTLFLFVYLFLAYKSLPGTLISGRMVVGLTSIGMIVVFVILSVLSFRHTFRATSTTPRAPRGYCFHCGGQLELRRIDGRERLACVACHLIHYNQLIIGAGALVQKNGKLLLIKRAHEPFNGLWGLPGGHVEVDEDPEIAAMREAAEETGLNVVPEGLAGAYFFNDHPRGSGVFLVYLCRTVGGKPMMTAEASRISYFAPARLPKELAGGGHRAAVEAWAKQVKTRAKAA